ncbi:hypothetical protein [Pedosphaera parvula]|uniref:Uncharacterized protein n=1 Tax=Pedosphaera parvula (strain Ellin514) TaxID=320771 RepID=B9XQE2_PEDPL|nr:hypothetical protein [Pedosphaera parvula]EEF57966.1 hypothetical protein Cflav_PD1141 [Pedosphaera parvula Ellin514]
MNTIKETPNTRRNLLALIALGSTLTLLTSIGGGLILALGHAHESVTQKPLVFGCMGLFFTLWMLLSLWRGEISVRGRTIIYRSSDPFEFYTWIFYYVVLATLFIGAGIFFWLHPHFSLIPAIPLGLDE